MTKGEADSLHHHHPPPKTTPLQKNDMMDYRVAKGSSLASTVASYGVTINLLQFLVCRFNTTNIRASQITNIISSVTCLSPVARAVLCDSYLGYFLTIFVFTFISFLVWDFDVSIASIASIHGATFFVQPPTGPVPTPHVDLICVPMLGIQCTTQGTAGTSFTCVTVGSNQFDRKEEQQRYVSYYFLTTTASTLVPSMVTVYVMDNVGWNWGNGLCAVLSVLELCKESR
ncbi:hypothetical protein EJ110_NYTH13524 [Nymphaea thermarum]|nr:hypothetical protein EJ110_NYTH13524 [Nymphaea thermarum]